MAMREEVLAQEEKRWRLQREEIARTSELSVPDFGVGTLTVTLAVPLGTTPSALPGPPGPETGR